MRYSLRVRRRYLDRDVVTDPDRLPTYQRDRSTGSPAGEPFAVVFPRSTEQVSTVLAAAHEHRVPVVPGERAQGYREGQTQSMVL